MSKIISTLSKMWLKVVNLGNDNALKDATIFHCNFKDIITKCSREINALGFFRTILIEYQ